VAVAVGAEYLAPYLGRMQDAGMVSAMTPCRRGLCVRRAPTITYLEGLHGCTLTLTACTALSHSQLALLSKGMTTQQPSARERHGSWAPAPCSATRS
jgi:hypothetical protein